MGDLEPGVQGAVRLLVQRCDKAELLIQADTPEAEWQHIGKGLCLFVAFAEGAWSPQKMRQLCKSVLVAPLSSSSAWTKDHQAQSERAGHAEWRGRAWGVAVFV